MSHSDTETRNQKLDRYLDNAASVLGGAIVGLMIFSLIEALI